MTHATGQKKVSLKIFILKILKQIYFKAVATLFESGKISKLASGDTKSF
jgi:hypothetical protein